MFANYFQTLAILAERTAPYEAAAFLFYDDKGSLNVEPVPNTAQEVERFVVSPTDTYKAMKRPDFYGFFHSHCRSDENFSEMDQQQMRVCACPWLLYSVSTRKFNWACPMAARPSLLGRRFILGVQDCAALVADFYERYFEIRFPFFERSPTTLDLGHPLTRQMAMAQGFREVTDGSFCPNDLLFFRWRTACEITHVGVFVAGNRLLHQVCGQLSTVEVFSPMWNKRLAGVYRRPGYESLPVNL